MAEDMVVVEEEESSTWAGGDSSVSRHLLEALATAVASILGSDNSGLYISCTQKAAQ